MTKLVTLLTVLLYAATYNEIGACAAEQFKKLSASQIRAKFVGMEFTDHVHWVEAYGADGTLTTREMGKTRVGKWRVDEGQLCVDLGKEGGRDCYEVWTSGDKVELRSPGSSAPPFQGILGAESYGPIEKTKSHRRRAVNRAVSHYKKEDMMRVLSTVLFGGTLVMSATVAYAQNIDWQKVDEAFGRKPAVVSGDVHRYGFPRTDLTVTLDGVTIKPALALGGWVAFKAMGGEAMAMGDLVLLETEIKPVMTKLIENGLDITAVHNHLLRGSPATFYMHVGGHGDPVKMATAIRMALAESKTPLAPPSPPAAPPAVDLDTGQLDQIIGAKGQANGGVYQFGVPRSDPVTMDGMPIAPAGPMGLATGIGFQPTGGGKAAITGDFVMVSSEVNPVIKTLRANGIEVTALHSHMLDEQPRLFFMHFWANDDAIKLAKGLRGALDKMANIKNSL